EALPQLHGLSRAHAQHRRAQDARDAPRRADQAGGEADAPPQHARSPDLQQAQGVRRHRASPRRAEPQEVSDPRVDVAMAITSDSMTFYATGRRKTSVARVWLFNGSGKITINRREAERYVTRSTNMKIVEQPLQVTNTR